MSLNIKNKRACSLAGELAGLSGATKTGTMMLAQREHLEREQRKRDVAGDMPFISGQSLNAVRR